MAIEDTPEGKAVYHIQLVLHNALPREIYAYLGSYEPQETVGGPPLVCPPGVGLVIGEGPGGTSIDELMFTGANWTPDLHLKANEEIKLDVRFVVDSSRKKDITESSARVYVNCFRAGDTTVDGHFFLPIVK